MVAVVGVGAGRSRVVDKRDVDGRERGGKGKMREGDSKREG